MHGPGGIYTPTYPGIPTVAVFDGVATSLRPLKARRWRKHRDAALALWSGLTFDVTETEPITFVGLGQPDYEPGHIPGSEEIAPIQVGTITLGRSVYTPPAPKCWPMAWAFWSRFMGGSIAWFHLERLRGSEASGLPGTAIYSWDRAVCHEVGHCLGLWHGSNGVMGGGMVPSSHDLDSVRTYYLEAA